MKRKYRRAGKAAATRSHSKPTRTKAVGSMQARTEATRVARVARNLGLQEAFVDDLNRQGRTTPGLGPSSSTSRRFEVTTGFIWVAELKPN